MSNLRNVDLFLLLLNNCTLLLLVLLGFLDTQVNCYIQSIIYPYSCFPKYDHNCLSLSFPRNRTQDTNFGTAILVGSSFQHVEVREEGKCDMK